MNDLTRRFDEAVPSPPEDTDWGPGVRVRAARTRRRTAGAVVAAVAVAAAITVPVLIPDRDPRPPSQPVPGPVVRGLEDACPPTGAEVARPDDGLLPAGAIGVRICPAENRRGQAGSLPEDELTVKADELRALINGLDQDPTVICTMEAGRTVNFWFRYPGDSAVAISYDTFGCRWIDAGGSRTDLVGGSELLWRFAELLREQRAAAEPPEQSRKATCGDEGNSLLGVAAPLQLAPGALACEFRDGTWRPIGVLSPEQRRQINADFAVRNLPDGMPQCDELRPLRIVGSTVWGDAVTLDGSCGAFLVDPLPDPAETSFQGAHAWLPNSDLITDIFGGTTATDSELVRVAETFKNFATGKISGPPSDTPVDLYLGQRLVSTLTGRELDDRALWEVCTPEGSYAAASCPLSALDFIARETAPIEATQVRPKLECAPPEPELASPGGGRRISLVPRRELDCTSGWVVDLYVNDVGQVVAVNLTLSEP